MLNIFLVFALLTEANRIIFPVHSQECPAPNLGITSDLKPSDCYAKSRYYTTEKCLPLCLDFTGLILNKRCENAPCVPGTVCTQSGKLMKCLYDMDSCAKYYIPSGVYYDTIFRPECAPDGGFAPKQCKGEISTGRCFCVDSKGQRIFGQEWWNKAQDMTCECSRKKSDLRNKVENAPYFVSLHCDSKGNYEPLQCDVISEQCWCADTKSGDVTSPVVPKAALTKLPCYESATKVGSQYLRQCESKLYAQAKILHELKTHGTTSQYSTLLCDEDGSYGAFRIQDGQAYCSWKNNANIGAWQSDATDTSKLNCNCARDSKYFALAGKPQLQSCSGNGNYNQFQKSSGLTYCVDKDGYRKSVQGANPSQESDCVGIYEQGD